MTSREDHHGAPQARQRQEPAPGRLDDACQRHAQQIGHRHPRWLVMWGPYSRTYWAYPRLPVPQGTIVHAPDPEMLMTAIREVELAATQNTRPDWQH